MKFITTLIAACLAASVLPSLAEVDLSKMPPASPRKDVTYEKDIKPLFEASCIRCHGEKEKKAGLRLDSLEAVLKGTRDGKVVHPGEALKSSLLISVSQLDPETVMPPKPRARRQGQGPGAPGGERREGNAPANEAGNNQRPAGPGGPGGAGGPPPAKPLTPEEVGLVRAWIDQGAK